MKDKNGVMSSLQYSTDVPDEPYVTLGPIIGMVTDKTARVLIEVSARVSVKCFLTSENGQQFTAKKRFHPKRPQAFQFVGLTPETYYRVSLSIPIPGLMKSGFKTIPTDWSLRKRAANFAFVSCNKYRITRDEVPDKFDLWKDIYKKARRGEIDYLIHMGDNVYNDSDLYDLEAGTKVFKGADDDCRWHIAVTRLQTIAPEEWEDHYEEICEIFRSIYRETWNHPPTKHTYANVPNLMIMDDHDIRDDWGDRPTDKHENTLEFFAACCAYEVYNEYQRNLFEDYEYGRGSQDCRRVGQAYHFHVFGDIGLMFTDARASKTFHQKPEEDAPFPLLGAAQWRDIEQALSNDATAYFSNVRMLYAITPMPPCYIGEGPNMFIANMSKYFDDLFGAWTASKHVAEASLFLSALFDWRAQRPGFREVCIVGGDVHEGGYTDIIDLRYVELRDKRLDRMKQVTTSAVANTYVKWHQHQALNVARTMVNSCGKWHQFVHYKWTGMRNFAVLTAYLDKEKKERNPDYQGLVTRFRSQMFGAGPNKKKAHGFVDSLYRTYALAGGWTSCFGGVGMCGAGECGGGQCWGHSQAKSIPIWGSEYGDQEEERFSDADSPTTVARNSRGGSSRGTGSYVGSGDSTPQSSAASRSASRSQASRSQASRSQASRSHVSHSQHSHVQSHHSSR